ncbi:hypothetical protein [Paraburkholderia humisilvae]
MRIIPTSISCIIMNKVNANTGPNLGEMGDAPSPLQNALGLAAKREKPVARLVPPSLQALDLAATHSDVETAVPIRKSESPTQRQGVLMKAMKSQFPCRFASL